MYWHISAQCYVTFSVRLKILEGISAKRPPTQKCFMAKGSLKMLVRKLQFPDRHTSVKSYLLEPGYTESYLLCFVRSQLYNIKIHVKDFYMQSMTEVDMSHDPFFTWVGPTLGQKMRSRVRAQKIGGIFGWRDSEILRHKEQVCLFRVSTLSRL